MHRAGSGASEWSSKQEVTSGVRNRLGWAKEWRALTPVGRSYQRSGKLTVR